MHAKSRRHRRPTRVDHARAYVAGHRSDLFVLGFAAAVLGLTTGLLSVLP